MVLRPPYWKVILITLLVIGTMSLQASSLDSSHSQNHASHCCAVCHVGHLSALHSMEGFGFIPLALMCWHDPTAQSARALESQIVLSLSRAPPTLVSL